MDALETVTENIPIPENDTSVIVTQTTFAVSVRKIDPSTFMGLNFSAVLGEFTSDQKIDESALFFDDTPKQRPTGSLSLPSNLALVSKTNGTRVTLSVFVTDSLFLRRTNSSRKVGSVIIAAGVVGTERVENLDPPMTAFFKTNPVSV